MATRKPANVSLIFFALLSPQSCMNFEPLLRTSDTTTALALVTELVNLANNLKQDNKRLSQELEDSR